MAARAPNPDLLARIRHAERYPFARPAGCYLLADGAPCPLEPGWQHGRLPVIACGSNAAPARLVAKFGGPGERIPVTRARLADFAVVYASHFTAYGSVPATLHPLPGAAVALWVTWLNEAQLERMHESEGIGGRIEHGQRYDYVELSGLRLQLAAGGGVAAAGAYLARRLLALDGRPLALAEIPTQAAGLAQLRQPALLRRLHRLLEPALDYRAFMALILSGPAARQALFERLAPHSLARASARASAAFTVP
jgi:hypothetical protein